MPTRLTPVALLRVRYSLTRREFARALGITCAQLRGLERWVSPPPEYIASMERFLNLHSEIAAGFPSHLQQLRDTSTAQDERQISLFDFFAVGSEAPHA